MFTPDSMKTAKTRTNDGTPGMKAAKKSMRASQYVDKYYLTHTPHLHLDKKELNDILHID